MIALGARSGYEIRRASELSLRFFWALGPPQIYSELSRLEQAGLIAGSEEASGRRTRRVYELTDGGRRALRRWVSSADADALELRDARLLRLFFADASGQADLAGQLATIRRRSERALLHFHQDILPAAERTRERGLHSPALVARFGADLHEFIAGWCERVARGE